MKLSSELFHKETPYYLYNLDLLRQTIQLAKAEADRFGFVLHYAFKANWNEPILDLMRDEGLGADCVSGGEVQKALNMGFDANKIAFAGVGKSDWEIDLGIENNIFSFNVESIPELEVINERAAMKGKKAQVALRINPNVDANTHTYITTGLDENKFGLNMWEMETLFDLLPKLNNIHISGLHFHIGSQITDMNVFRQLCVKVNKVQEFFFDHQMVVEHINVGGGLGVNYHNPDSEPVVDFGQYFKVFYDFLELRPQQKLHFELGRSLVAQCGSLITKVLYVKKGAAKHFAILDAGMTELMRPALYQSFHFIDFIGPARSSIEKYDVVGPICESTDVFRKAVDLPVLKRGDLLAIRSAGAYGEVMAMKYNMRRPIQAFYQ
jgi:diaminopimelate decarboxylase